MNTLFSGAVTSFMSQRLLHTKTNSRHVSTMHSSQHKLCARKSELVLIMKFYLDFAMATNVHNKYVFPRCLDKRDSNYLESL